MNNIATKLHNNLIVFSDTSNPYNSNLYDSYLNNLTKVSSGISKNTIIQDCVSYLNDNDLCPAIFFTFSRIRCEQLAKSININLLMYF